MDAIQLPSIVLDTFSVRVKRWLSDDVDVSQLRDSPLSRQWAPLIRDFKSHSTTSLLCMRARTC
jgi:hypothetical protein